MILFAGIIDNFKQTQSLIAPNIDPDADLATFISGSGFDLFAFIFFLVGAVFFGSLLMAAWDYVSSNGDTKKVQNANTRILNSFFGIIIVLGSFVIVRIISSILGLESSF